jgi:hypothetical protein
MLAAPAAAAAGWDAAEPVAPGTDITRVFAAPGGPGYVVGFPLSSPFRYRAAPRPFGGTTGPPIPLPDTSGENFIGDWQFDAAGNALIANTDKGTVTYRAANGTGGASQAMPPGLKPQRISVAPTGEAMVGLGATPFGPVQVAFRAAGSTTQVDLAPGAVETFSASGVLVGLLLQADGGAVVVWLEGDTLRQAVRQAGAASFGAPSDIPDPRPDVRKFGVAFRGSSSGHAMVAWLGSTGGTARDQVVASVRAPGGSFPAASVVGSGATIASVSAAMTASGAGIATWRQDAVAVAGQPVAVTGATVHAGVWAPAAPIGPSAWPLVSIPANLPVSGTNDIAVGMIQIQDSGTPTTFSDDRRGLFVHHFRASPAGLVDQGISELSPLQARPGGATSFATIEDIAMEPGGRILAYLGVDGDQALRSFDGVPPGAPGNPVVPPLTPVPAPAPPGGSPPGLVPIVAKGYVVLKPIDPKTLQVTATCTADDVASGDCSMKLALYQALTGKKGTIAAKPRRLVKLASAGATLKRGQRRAIRLRPTRAGRRVIARGKRVKVVLEVTVTRAGRTGTARLATTLKARRR